MLSSTSPDSPRRSTLKIPPATTHIALVRKQPPSIPPPPRSPSPPPLPLPPLLFLLPDLLSATTPSCLPTRILPSDSSFHTRCNNPLKWGPRQPFRSRPLRLRTSPSINTIYRNSNKCSFNSNSYNNSNNNSCNSCNAAPRLQRPLEPVP